MKKGIHPKLACGCCLVTGINLFMTFLILSNEKLNFTIARNYFIGLAILSVLVGSMVSKDYNKKYNHDSICYVIFFSEFILMILEGIILHFGG